MIAEFPFRRLMIDTSPLIYFIEEHPDYLPKLKFLFEKIDAGEIESITSTITLIEVLIQPKKQSDHKLESKYLEILLNNANLKIVPIDTDVACKAAEIRAIYNIKIPDAIQVATGIFHTCDAFLTNDRTLKKIREIKILTIQDILL